MGSGQRTRARRRLRFLSLSVALHAAGAVLLWTAVEKRSSRVSDDVFELELEEHAAPTAARPANATPPAGAHDREKRPRGASKRAREERLRAFLPSALDSRADFTREDDASLLSARVTISKNFADDWAYVSDPMNEPTMAAGLVAPSRALWRLIDDELREDPLLSEYNHTGFVYVRFALDRAGRLRESSLSVRAQDPILKVRSMKALRRGVATFANTGLLREKDETWFAARFSWIERSACHRQSRWNGHFLGFCRHAVDRTRDHSTVSRAGRVTGMALKHGPFGFAEAYDQYKKENWRHDSKFDPFESERRDPDYDL